MRKLALMVVSVFAASLALPAAPASADVIDVGGVSVPIGVAVDINCQVLGVLSLVGLVEEASASC